MDCTKAAKLGGGSRRSGVGGRGSLVVRFSPTSDPRPATPGGGGGADFCFSCCSASLRFSSCACFFQSVSMCNEGSSAMLSPLSTHCTPDAMDAIIPVGYWDFPALTESAPVGDQRACPACGPAANRRRNRLPCGA